MSLKADASGRESRSADEEYEQYVEEERRRATARGPARRLIKSADSYAIMRRVGRALDDSAEPERSRWDLACSRGGVAAVFAIVYLPFCQAAVVSHDGLIYARRAEILYPGFFDGKILYILVGHLTLALTGLVTDGRSAMLLGLSALSAIAMAGAAQALYIALRARDASLATSLLLVAAFATSPLVVLLGVHPAHYALPAAAIATALASYARGRPGWAFVVATVGISAHIYLALAALVFGAAALGTLPRKRSVAFVALGASLLLGWFLIIEPYVVVATTMRIFCDDYFLFTATAFAPNPPIELLAYAASTLLSLTLACPVVLAAAVGMQRGLPRERLGATLAALYLLLVFLVPSEQLAVSPLGQASTLGESAYLPLIVMKMHIFVLPPLLFALAPAVERARRRLESSAVTVFATLLVAPLIIAGAGLRHAQLPLDETSLASLREVEADALVYARWSFPELSFLSRQEVRPLYGSLFLTSDAELARLLEELHREVRSRPVYIVDELLDPEDLVAVEDHARSRHAQLVEALETRFCVRPHLEGLRRVEPGPCPGRDAPSDAPP